MIKEPKDIIVLDVENKLVVNHEHEFHVLTKGWYLMDRGFGQKVLRQVEEINKEREDFLYKS